jgi:hypothetical protein
LYEGDRDGGNNAAARSYNRPGSNWGFSSTGDFMDDNNFYDNKYTLQSNSNIWGLYATARKTPLSITYYGFCLENGNYTVRLHFAEIEFTDEKLYNKVASRVFDIYIQVINYLFLPKRLWMSFFFFFKGTHLSRKLCSREYKCKRILTLQRKPRDRTEVSQEHSTPP